MKMPAWFYPDPRIDYFGKLACAKPTRQVSLAPIVPHPLPHDGGRSVIQRGSMNDGVYREFCAALAHQVERLERALSEAKPTENRLREEILEAAERDAACRKRHAAALEEVRTSEIRAG